VKLPRRKFLHLPAGAAVAAGFDGWLAADTDRDAGDLQVVRSKNAPGGGGTSFGPVFEWIESTM
jgi:hypothetical protein